VKIKDDMKNLLILSFSHLHTDPRVNRQIRFLSSRHNLTTLGLSAAQIPDIHSLITAITPKNNLQKLQAAATLLSQNYEYYYWNQPHIQHSYQQLHTLKFDLIIANDIDALPLALKIANGAKIIFDAHEYAPREFEDRLTFRLLFQNYKTYLCQTYIPQIDRMITVCQSIADTYEQDTGVKPTVITNAPDYEDLQPQLLNAETPKIRLVHHGGAMKSRRLDKLIHLMKFLDDRYELNLILTGPFNPYINYLKKLAQDYPNIHFLDPVPMREISQYLNNFDIGVYILEPSNFNNLNALPNKLFEFIQARLAIAIGPSPEMARIVKDHDLGVIAQDFEPESLAQKIMALDYSKINDYKQQSHKVARQLSAEKNQEIFLNLVQDTLEN
jgi:hypothetical protein